ncbi:hypothetical protein CEXT_535791 [Caerostris extrusa]|uniref:Uncharacterized protein n=1 Tax=Caerostris extrusa TaxID=172846 RepID=A0AAV4W1G5_CAEEX|nr:hypothetical protein CEXT_535791 [Caerostris extrusa]
MFHSFEYFSEEKRINILGTQVQRDICYGNPKQCNGIYTVTRSEVEMFRAASRNDNLVPVSNSVASTRNGKLAGSNFVQERFLGDVLLI